MLKLKNIFGKEYDVVLRVGRYANNNNLYVALLCRDEEYGGFEPYCDVTVNIGELMDGMACIDTNNNPVLKAWLEKQKLGEFVGLTLPSGFCNYPVFLFDMDRLQVLCEEHEKEMEQYSR